MMSILPWAVQEKIYPYGTRIFWYGDAGVAGFVPPDKQAPSFIEESKQALRELIAQAPDPCQVYIVFHFQNLSSLSPRLRQTALDIVSALSPNQTLSAAILLQNNLMFNVITVFTATLRRQFGGRFEYSLFKDEVAALKWLQQIQATNST